MGQQLSLPATAAQPLENLLTSELPALAFKEGLAQNRLCKSALCVHDDGGLVVIKVYTKRPDMPDLRPYEERLMEIRGRLLALEHPHAWPAQRVYQSERAIYLIRQYIFASLTHRISSRPFLAPVEKRWIAYQLLQALAQCHEAGVCHGDIKPENVVVTSWGWAFLVDFAPFKPTLLPADNPADFSFFFDTSGRRKCYLAPERFYDPGGAGPAAAGGAANGRGGTAAAPGGQHAVPPPPPLTPAMDVFSLGCVLAELFLDGAPLFDYSRLLAYRLGNHDPAPALERADPALRALLLHMLQRDPGRRLSAREYLERMGSALLPPCLVAVVVPFFSSLLRADTDTRVAAVAEQYPSLKAELLGGEDAGSEESARGGEEAQATARAAQPPQPAAVPSGWQAAGSGEAAAAAASPREGSAALLAEAQAVLHALDGRRSPSSSLPGTPQHKRPSSRSGSSQGEELGPAGADAAAATRGAAGRGREATALPAHHGAGADSAGTSSPAAGSSPDCLPASLLAAAPRRPPCDGMILVAALLCTLLRGARLQEAKASMVALLCDAAAHVDDDTRLQRVLPYLVAAASEQLAAVKCLALRGIARVFAQVRHVPPSDAKLFSEYILPSLSLLPADPELSVQVEFASVVALLAAVAQRFLEGQQRGRAGGQAGGGGGGGSGGGSPPGARAEKEQHFSYDEEVSHLRGAVERVVHELLVGPRAEPKLALLPRLPALVGVAGRRDTADVLLPPLLTLFNSQDWRLRAALYGAGLDAVCGSLGAEGLVAIVLPFVDRMLADPEPAVVAEAAALLERLAARGLLRKQAALAVAAKLCARGLLAAPCTAVRGAALAFVAAAAGQLSAADVYARLLPVVSPHLAHEPLEPQSQEQLAAALPEGPTLRPQGWAAQQQQREQRQRQAPDGPRGAAGTQRRHSLDAPAAAGVAGQPRQAPRRPGAGGGGGGGRAGRPGSQSLLIPPSIASFSILVNSRFLTPGSSYLSAALEQSVVGSHVLPAPQQQTRPRARRAAPLSGSAHALGAPEAGARLVAHARRSAPLLPAGIAEGAASMYAGAATGLYSISSPEGEGAGPPGAGAGAGGTGGGGPPDEEAGLPPPWYPRGVLVAHLAEHKKSVNRLAVAESGAFFVSASSDETCKVWDVRRLEKDVSFRSRLTYTAQVGRITAVAPCQDSQSVASASSSGSIHVWRVEYAARGAGGPPDRYSGIVSMRQLTPGGGGVLDLQSWGPSLLVHSTQGGGVAGWDLRAGADAWRLQAPPERGLAARLACDPGGHNWLVTGSSRGWLTLWDLRFRLPVSAWRQPTGAPTGALALAAAPPARLGLRAAAGPLVYVAADDSEVGLWDVAESKCLQVLRVLRQGAAPCAQRAVPGALAPPPPPGGAGGRPAADMMSRAKQLGLGELQAPQARREGFRALLPTAGGPLLTGGTDRVVRCWDAGRPPRSYVMCAPPPAVPPPQAGAGGAAPGGGGGAAAGAAAAAALAAAADGGPVTLVDVPRYHHAVRSVGGLPVVEESVRLERSASGGPAAEAHLGRLGWAERAAAAAHQQAVLDLAAVQASEPLLLSCSQDGVIKAWR